MELEQPLPLSERLQRVLGWTPSSLTLLSVFVVTCSLIVYIWWPLAEELLRVIDWEGEWWRYMDWLLFGIFGFMSLMIMAGADLRRDGLIVFVGAFGGLVIESWGTQTHIWNYYTLERPPLWIIPAWPIANLTIDRMVRLLNEVMPQQSRAFKVIYWPVFAGFMALMLIFIAPTFTRSMTLAALWLCLTLILTPKNHRLALMHFTAGAGLGYFLELWGTTRQCWTYYTLETPPLFAVLAHGMAAVAFWRTGDLVMLALNSVKEVVARKPAVPTSYL